MADPWLLAQVLVTSALAGLCWTVQLAIYPHFSRVLAAAGAAGFRDYHAAYTRSMGYVVGPLMVAELGLALLWAFRAPPAESAPALLGTGAVVALWVFTFAVMVPLHSRLDAEPAASLARRLTLLNWPRTALWAARALLLAWVLFSRSGGRA